MSGVRRWLATLAGLVLAQAPGLVTAQIATDGTAGPRRELTGQHYDIGDDLGTRAGRNLFHSFERFSLGSGESATFRGPDAIRNVISRVTGGERSRIRGTIASTMPNADFFFLNPAGVALGSGARLDLPGSFHVSTADGLRFANGERFSARLGDGSHFSFASPEAFGFIGANPAPVTVNQSGLVVRPGETISIVGGEIDVGLASLVTTAGRIMLSALGGPGEARLGNGEIVAERRADVTLRGGSRLITRGDGGGTIRIRGGAIVVEETDTIVTAANTGPRDSQGGIEVEGHSLEMRGGARLTTVVFNEDPAAPAASGRGGNVSVGADEVEIAGADTSLEANTFAQGNGGTVTVVARDLEIRGGARISSSSSATGEAGTVSVRARDIHLREGGEISTESRGAGNSGRIRVRADVLELRNGGLITAQSTGAGTAGAVRVDVDDRVLLLEGSSVSTESASAGGGRIALQGGDALVLRASDVTTSVQGGTDPTAGNILIDPKVLVIDGGKIQAIAPQGFGGRVRIAADNILAPEGDFQALLDREDISASGGDPTRSGTIAVSAPEVDLSGGLVVLEGVLLDAASQLRERCGARRDIGASSFTGVGRGGLPPSPDGPLAGAYVTSEAVPVEVMSKARSKPTERMAAAPNVRLAGLTLPCAPLD